MTVKSDRKWLTHRRTFFLLLSGAQGAGKTTMLQMLKYVLASQGEYSRTNQGEADLRLCTICEGATKLILHQQSAAPTATATSPVHFQNTLLEYQTACEREAYELAHNGNADDIDVLIISDRGRLDGKLYCSAETWEAIDGEAIGHARYPHHIGPPNEWPAVRWSAVHVIKWGYCPTFPQLDDVTYRDGVEWNPLPN
jgi:energy-coupling factor transporter ATP-binding protein EcfA2